MSNDSTADLAPTEAVQELTEIEQYDETLTARAFGVTLMVFAVAIAAIPVSYAGAGPWLAGRAYGSLILGLLWLPWIAAAVCVTSVIWNTHSITLGESVTTGRSWLFGVGFTVLYISIAVVVQAALGGIGDPFVLRSLSSGLFTLCLGLVFWRLYGARHILVALGLAGIGIVLGSLALVPLGLSTTAAGFTTGFLQGGVYFVTGLLFVIRG